MSSEQDGRVATTVGGSSATHDEHPEAVRPVGASPADGMTIDELARASGTTTRTIRSYQDRGLLSPPTIVGRTGYYDPQHLARLQMIGRLLDQRFSLAAIGALFQAWDSGRTLAQILGFVEELTTPFEAEVAQVVSAGDIAEVFPDNDEEYLRRAEGLGILRALPTGGRAAGDESDDPEAGDARFEVLSPRLLDTGAKLVAAGVPLDRLLAEGEQLREDCDRIAERFVDLFMTYIWEPFTAAGRPAAELDRVIDYLAITRPLPVDATSVMIAQAMQRRLEKSLADIVADEDGAPIDLT